MKNYVIILRILLLVVVGVFIWSGIKPASYFDWAAEVLPGVVSTVIIIAIYRKFKLTTLSYSVIALICILTFIGGHYTYPDVPFFNWLKETFHLKRNHYDRFVHLMSGLLIIVIL